MPTIKLNSLQSQDSSAEITGTNGAYLPAAGGGFNNDFNDANLILQKSLGLAVSTTQDMSGTPSNVATSTSGMLHKHENVDAVLLD